MGVIHVRPDPCSCRSSVGRVLFYDILRLVCVSLCELAQVDTARLFRRPVEGKTIGWFALFNVGFLFPGLRWDRASR